MNQNAQAIRRALVLGLEVEAADPNMAESVPDLSDQQLDWIALWLASEEIGPVGRAVEEIVALRAAVDVAFTALEPHCFHVETYNGFDEETNNEDVLDAMKKIEELPHRKGSTG